MGRDVAAVQDFRHPDLTEHMINNLTRDAEAALCQMLPLPAQSRYLDSWPMVQAVYQSCPPVVVTVVKWPIATFISPVVKPIGTFIWEHLPQAMTNWYPREE